MAGAADKKIQQLKLGNNLWETAVINNRLQVTEFKLGTTRADDGKVLHIKDKLRNITLFDITGRQ